MKRFPELGKDVRRPFQVHEVCFDCAEFYHGCAAWPASKSMKSADKKHLRCLDFLPLPDVLLPADERRGNVLVRHVRYEDIEKAQKAGEANH